MNILIGLIPAVCWGTMPIVAEKIGGKPSNQMMGTAIGAFLVGVVAFLVYQPQISPMVFLISFLSGVGWGLGQMLLFVSYTYIGIVTATPITTALQLTGTSLMGMIAFGELPGLTAKLVGFLAIALIVAGAAFTTYREKNGATADTATPAGGSGKSNMKMGLAVLVVSMVGYVAYSSLPKFTEATGFQQFFPQTLGILVIGVAFALISTKGRAVKEKISYKSIVIGVIFGIGAFVYLFSIASNGLAVGFALTQMNVVIATLGGIFLLKESKTKKEMVTIVIGLLLVVGGGMMINFA